MKYIWIAITTVCCGIIWLSGYWWCDSDWRDNLCDRGLMERRGGIGIGVF